MDQANFTIGILLMYSLETCIGAKIVLIRALLVNYRGHCKTPPNGVTLSRLSLRVWNFIPIGSYLWNWRPINCILGPCVVALSFAG